jgi:hypothetical protein
MRISGIEYVMVRLPLELWQYVQSSAVLEGRSATKQLVVILKRAYRDGLFETGDEP